LCIALVHDSLNPCRGAEKLMILVLNCMLGSRGDQKISYPITVNSYRIRVYSAISKRALVGPRHISR